MPNAASTHSFVVKAKPQSKSRRCAWPCSLLQQIVFERMSVAPILAPPKWLIGNVEQLGGLQQLTF
jgi:hypothetical protein